MSEKKQASKWTSFFVTIWNWLKKPLGKSEAEKRITEYRDVLQKNPRSTTATRNLAEVCARAGKKEEAIGIYLQIADQYQKEGFFLKAIATLENALNVDPNRWELVVRVAEIYKDLGRPTEARIRLEKLAAELERRGQSKPHLEVLKKIADLEPRDHLNRVRLAEMFSHKGRYAEAAEQYRLAADLLFEQEQWEEFVKVAEDCLRLSVNPENPQTDTRVRAAQALLRQKKPVEALLHLKAAYRADSKNGKLVDILEHAAAALHNLLKNSEEIAARQILLELYKETGAKEKCEACRRDLARLVGEE